MYTVGKRLVETRRNLYWRWCLIKPNDETALIYEDYATTVGFAAILNSRKFTGISPVAAVVLASKTRGETINLSLMDRIREAKKYA